MIRIDRSIGVRCAPERVFELISEPLRFPKLFRAFTRVEQVSEAARCQGARYLMLLQVGPIDAGGVMRVTDWHPPLRVEWTSERGVMQSGAVTIDSGTDGLTEVRIRMGYVVPGPRLGAFLVGRMTRHVIDRHVHAMLLSIKRWAEFEAPAACVGS
jgi:hypothetical protein